MKSQIWGKLSITAKFASGFGILLLLIAMIAITGYFALDDVREAEKIIKKNTEVHDIVLEIEHSMEKGRRLHANFFLYYPVIGYVRAYDLYAQKIPGQLNEVAQKTDRLKEILQNSRIDSVLQANHIDLNLYLSSAKRFADTSAESIDLLKELSGPGNGQEILLEQYTAALQIETAEYMQLHVILEKMISFSKEYLINRQRFHMQSSFNTLENLRKALETVTSMTPDQKQRVTLLLDQWRSTAEKILVIDVDLRSKFKDFSLQTDATDPAATALIKFAKADVENAQSQIIRAHRSAVIIITVIAVAALFLALIIARLLNNSITRNIISLTQSADAFQHGNLNARARVHSSDELGQLARTFNTMADRIRELIDNLELKINERTAELSKSEKRFRAIVENTSQGILIVDAATMTFLYANPAITTMLEYNSPDELIGKKVPDIHPEKDRPTVAARFFNMVAGTERFISDVPCIKKSGTTFYADIVTGKVLFSDKPCLVAFFLDTTEKRNLQGQLERARKMEAIGLLAGGVAHDLNNILSGIVSYPELLLLQIPADSSMKRPLMAIHESGKRAAAVVSDLLTVARGVASVKEPTDLNRLVREYMTSPEHLEVQASHPHITCRQALDPDLVNISCSPIHIKKCILNLMINAMEAIDHKGSIIISTRNYQVQEEEKTHAGLKSGRYAVLSLSDTGSGIAKEDLEHIFEPFYTKKKMGKSGTGLGLAVVWNSIQDHDGNITVESTTQGTTFNLFFPATEKQISQNPKQTTLTDFRGRGESILVVDDEPQQLDITKRILENLNYSVHCVKSGEEAIAYMEKGHADLILLDMIMDPGINGLKTYEQILQHHPGQKAIIVSGFAESGDVRMAQSFGAQEFIKKPFSIEELGKAVMTELQKKQPETFSR